MRYFGRLWVMHRDKNKLPLKSFPVGSRHAARRCAEFVYPMLRMRNYYKGFEDTWWKLHVELECLARAVESSTRRP